MDFTAHLTDPERALLIRALEGRLCILLEHGRTKALLERIEAIGKDRFARFDPAPADGPRAEMIRRMPEEGS